MIISALAAIGYKEIQMIFIVLGLLLGIIGIFISLITDIWGLIPSKGGVGLFLGTFNPVHKSHITILKQFINERQLDKVYIHPTVIPKMHQYLLDKGMIEIVKEEAGKRYYEKSASADPLVNFFPTGKVFYEAENRVYMLKTAIEEAGLAKKVKTPNWKLICWVLFLTICGILVENMMDFHHTIKIGQTRHRHC
ncbi:hypothetical protein GCM10025879_01680 [Leuconostoc litchii]|uniref:hypothetical protein n=1 Tax=Leuconostoc litchii TaxID=1981069 RepID=UPI001FCBB14F|nr:hypothetical protein [Leuconostoc litchii]GMA68922.1 hypothetical protein GCM10025879_01680 [Leuconostoc litchii]